MKVNRRTPKKPRVKPHTRSLGGKNTSADVLERLTTEESIKVLQILLDRYPAFRGEAREIATNLVSSPSIDDVAEDVHAAVTGIGMDAMSSRAGKKSWGYVEPTEAAWELLEEAVEDMLTDIKRRMKLGLEEAAQRLCRGIVTGLHRAKGTDADGPLAWAPDFPAEHACHAVAELIRACPARKRKATCARLLEALAGEVPDWRDMLQRAARQAVSGR